jgi:hypothetical protein
MWSDTAVEHEALHSTMDVKRCCLLILECLLYLDALGCDLAASDPTNALMVYSLIQLMLCTRDHDLIASYCQHSG